LKLERPQEQPKPEGELKPEEKPPELIFGKYKSLEDAQKGYKELERSFHEKSQIASQASKQVDYLKQFVDVSRLQEGAQQVAQESVKQEVQSPDLLDLLVNNPQEFERRSTERAAHLATAYMETQRIVNLWEQQNPDLVQYKHLINSEVVRLANDKPELVGNVPELLSLATNNLRSAFNFHRQEGQKEAMQVQSESRGFAISQVPQSSEHVPQPPVEKPAGQSFDDYITERRQEFDRKTFGFGGSTGPLK